jgi:hypothetical protein
LSPTKSVIHAVTNVQFFQQLATIGAITQEEALAAVGRGALPSVLQRTVDAIEDTTQRFAANMYLTGSTAFYRNHPLMDAIGASLGVTAAQMDELFVSAVAL